MKKRIFAALLALCLTVLTGCDWSDNTDDIFGTLTDYYNVENKDKDKDVKLTSFALPYLKDTRAASRVNNSPLLRLSCAMAIFLGRSVAFR